MHSYTSDIIAVSLERMNPLQGVVIEHPDLHVVGAGDDPVLARHELRRSHRQIAHLECLHQGLRLVVPDVDVALIQRAEHPWLRRVEVHALHSVRSGRQLPLDVQS